MSMARLLLSLSGVLVLLQTGHAQRLQDWRGVNRPYDFQGESQIPNSVHPMTGHSFYPLRKNTKQPPSNIQRSRGDLKTTLPLDKKGSSSRIPGRRKGITDSSFSLRLADPRIRGKRPTGPVGYRKSTISTRNRGFPSRFDSNGPRGSTFKGKPRRYIKTPNLPNTFRRRETPKPRAPVRRRLPRKLNKSWRETQVRKQNSFDRKKWTSDRQLLKRKDNIILKIAPPRKGKVKDAPFPLWMPSKTSTVQDRQREYVPRPGRTIRVEQMKKVRTFVEKPKTLPVPNIYEPKKISTSQPMNLLERFDSEFRPNTLALGVTFDSPGRNGGGDLSHHWSYKGEAGPANWSLLYPTCSGTRQSPVNIQDRNIIYQDLPPFKFNNFDGSRTAFRLTNNGHTASISIYGNMSVEGGGLDGQYNTAELHFHWGSSNNLGSEHSINGRKYPLEMHIVSYATKYGSLTNAMRFRDGLAVLGTFFDVTRENPYFRPIEEGLIRAKYAGNITNLQSVNLLGLIPADTSRYYRYYGSLTTPPCHQSVMWTLFEDVQYISPYQIQMLRLLYESHHESHDHGGHGGHAEGRRQGGHGFASNRNTPMKALPLEEFLMDNYRPTQPHFDRVINCNILRYADPQYIQQSRSQLDSNPRQNDFISQRLSQINVDALFNKTLQRWLQSKGLSPNALTPEQLGMHAQGHEAAHLPQHESFNLGHPGPVRGNSGNTGPGRGDPHTSHQGHSNGINHGQGVGNTQGGTSQTGAGAARPPDQLDLQVIQTQRIGPNGEQLTEIQVQLDPNGPNGAMTQEELQQLLGDPAIIDQIRQIVSSQTGGNGQVHEIIVAAPATANQGFAPSQFQDPQAYQGAGASPQGSTMQGAPQTLQTASGQNEIHVIDFHPSVPQPLIDELLRYPQWSLHYNETLIEINDLMRDLAAASVGTAPPPRQNQMNQFQPAQPLPVQGVQPGLLQGQGVQVGHLEGVNMNLQGVHVDQVGMGHGHTHGVGHSHGHGQGHGGMGQGQGTLDQGHRSMGHSQGHVGQSHGNIGQGIGDIGQGNMGQGHMQSLQFGQSQNIGQQGLGNNFGQTGSQFDQHQTGGRFIQRAPTFQVDPFSAINGNIHVDPIQSVPIGQQTGNMGRVDLSRSGGTQRFQNVGANTGQADLQIISAREMKFLPWK